MSEDTITVFNPVQPEEYFVLKVDKSLERIAADAPTQKDHIAVFNPAITGLYVEDGNVVIPVEKLEEGQKPYEFPDQFTVYMRV